MSLSNGGPPLVDPDVKPMQYVPFTIQDFLKGVRGMKFQDVGAYILVLMHLYEAMGDLPDDDRWMAVHIGVDIRTWKTAKARLIELGKIEVRAGRIWNRRVEEEITSYVKKVRAKQKESEDARRREAEKRAKRDAEAAAAAAAEAARKEAEAAAAAAQSLQGSREIFASSRGISPEFSRSSPGSLREIGDDLSKNANEINEAPQKPAPGNRAGIDQEAPLDKKIVDSDKKNQSPPALESSVAARAGGPEIPGLNGATALIVTDVAKWLSPWSPDEPGAYKQIGEAIRIYGERAVRDGYAEMKADIADGKLRAPSVKSLYGYFRVAKDRPPTRTASGKPTAETSSDAIRRIKAIAGDRS